MLNLSFLLYWIFPVPLKIACPCAKSKQSAQGFFYRAVLAGRLKYKFGRLTQMVVFLRQFSRQPLLLFYYFFFPPSFKNITDCKQMIYLIIPYTDTPIAFSLKWFYDNRNIATMYNFYNERNLNDQSKKNIRPTD